MKRTALLILIILTVLTTAQGYEKKLGKMKILLNEDLGTFSLYDNSDRENPISLLLDSDTTTSGLFILVDDKVYEMGQASSFVQTVEDRPNGAAFVWTSPAMTVTMGFTFLRSPSSQIEDGVKLDISVRNNSGSTKNVGVRLLLDTYLGEEENNHFILAGGENVSREQTLTGSFPSYWVSGEPSKGSALQVMVSQRGTTSPAQVVFANWKRLDASNWVFQSRDRNFNYLPYSVNDSAVSHWYDPVDIEDGSVRTVTLQMGLYNPQGFSATSQPVQSVVVESSAAESPVIVGAQELSDDYTMLDRLREDLTRVNAVLQEIEKTMSAEGEVDPDRMAALELMVKELKARQGQYLEE